MVSRGEAGQGEHRDLAGKTVALHALAQAWTAEGGTLIGLAPSAGAAQMLRGELGQHAAAADTLAKLVDAITTGRAVPEWAAAIGPGSLVIIDEAGMAGTLDLATAVDFVTGRGGSVRLVGDDQQLATIGAGGLLRDIQRTHGAVTLDTVRRFTHADGHVNHGEAAASLALRAVAVWRAAHAVPDTDSRPTGPPRDDLHGHRAQHDLDLSIRQATRQHRRQEATWRTSPTSSTRP